MPEVPTEAGVYGDIWSRLETDSLTDFDISTLQTLCKLCADACLAAKQSYDAIEGEKLPFVQYLTAWINGAVWQRHAGPMQGLAAGYLMEFLEVCEKNVPVTQEHLEPLYKKCHTLLAACREPRRG